MGCLKFQFWVPYYLTYFYVMFFMVDDIDIACYADDNTPYPLCLMPILCFNLVTVL